MLVVPREREREKGINVQRNLCEIALLHKEKLTNACRAASHFFRHTAPNRVTKVLPFVQQMHLSRLNSIESNRTISIKVIRFY